MDETPGGTTASDGADWAICCSGGGIRSATYCLGALQSLAREIYPRTKWIVGVAGGSYIPPSLSLARHGLNSGDEPAYEPGSAEEQHLRNNTRYIAPDAKTVLVGALSLLLGVAVTFTLVMAPVYALSHVWGWLLRSQSILTWTHGQGASASVTAWSWWLAPAVAAGLTLILFTFWWATLPTQGAYRGAQRARWTGWGAVITVHPRRLGAAHAARPAGDRLAVPQHRHRRHDRARHRLRRGRALDVRHADRPGRRADRGGRLVPQAAGQGQGRPDPADPGRLDRAGQDRGPIRDQPPHRLAGQRDRGRDRRGGRAHLGRFGRPHRLPPRPAGAGRRRGRGHARHPGRGRLQPAVAARRVPLAAGHRLRRDPGRLPTGRPRAAAPAAGVGRP